MSTRPTIGRIAACVFAIGLAGAPATLAQAPDWPSERPPRALPARDVRFPPFDLQKLSNGLQVVVVQHHEQPVVSMRLLIRSGASAEGRGKAGVARLTAGLLDQGTTTRSAQDIADTIDFIGGAEATGAGVDLSYLNMVVMKDSLGLGMQLLAEMARTPAFRPEEIDRQRQQTLSGLRVQQDDPSYVADAVFDRLVYGFHPYGMPASGTPETIAAITREDLVEFHDRYYVPNNAILALVGDVTTDEAMVAARKSFDDWKARDIAAARPALPPDPSRRVVVVNKPDAVQTEVRVGHIGIPRNHPDYMAVNLAIRILGGEGSNRLHQVLRTERGLTYGAQAEMDALKDSGDFEAETNTRSAATGEVLRLIVDEFWRLQRERVGEIELADAKAYLTGSFPLTIETPNAIAMQVLNVLFYDLPVEELQNFRDRVTAVTVDDIQRVARQYLRPDHLSVVLVGDASAFASQLKGLGFSAYDVVDLNDLDLTAAGLKRQRAEVTHPRDPQILKSSNSPILKSSNPQMSHYRLTTQQAVGRASIEPKASAAAQALLNQVIAAKGGLERLRGIRSVVLKQHQTAHSPDGVREGETTIYLSYPNRVRVDNDVSDGVRHVTQQQGFDGERGWSRDPMGVHDVSAQMLREIVAGLRRDEIPLLLGAADGRVRARLLPDVKDADGRTHQALELSAGDFEPIVLYIDPISHLVDRRAYVAGTTGQPLVEERLTDYRPVEGIQVAFSGSISMGGRAMVERRVDSITFNTPVDPVLFKRPAS